MDDTEENDVQGKMKAPQENLSRQIAFILQHTTPVRAIPARHLTSPPKEICPNWHLLSDPVDWAD
jgi:hypothetical protein